MKIEKNQGYILIGLLVVAVIIVMLYMIDLTAMFGPIDKNRAYEERPWFEQQRLLGKNALPIKQTGKKGKTVISSQTILKGNVQRNDENRGNLEIVIEPNGLAAGRWQCEYEYTDSSYTISAQFKGNIDPTKTFENENGKNKQLLYLITKGKYEQIKTDKKTANQWPIKQTIYVVGWIYPVRDKASTTPDDRQRGSVSNGIDKDYSAKGKLFLMADDDEESHGNAEYDWQSK